MSLTGLLQFVGRSLQRLELSLSQAAGFDRFGECIYCNERVMTLLISLYINYIYITLKLA